jgi:ABC-2 type transport system ATP-binding protein
MEPAISVHDLRKNYGATLAVRGISFDVAPGEVFGLLGAHGAGKTTTIEILDGHRPRTAGDVRVLGTDPSRPTPEWRGRIGLALDDRDRDVFFLDDPTAGFDPSARREAWGALEGLRALGRTTVLTTRDTDEAQRLADRVAIMRGGEIVATGTLEEIRRSLAGGVVVRFRLPTAVWVPIVRAEVDPRIEVSGAEVTLRTHDAQRVLYRLTGWAERERVRLESLEVMRPRLDELFRELMAEDRAR